MNVNEAIKILIEASIVAQKSGVFTVFEAREVANAIDEIERASKEQEKANRQAEQEIIKRRQMQEGQQAVPPVAPQS